MHLLDGREAVARRVLVPGERVPDVVHARGRVVRDRARSEHVRGLAARHAGAQQQPRLQVQLGKVTAEQDAVVHARAAAVQQAQQLLQNRRTSKYNTRRVHAYRP